MDDAAQMEQRVGDRLVEITRLLLGENSDVTLRRVITLACESIPGCDDASVILVERNGVRTSAATTDDVLRLDMQQIANSDGPSFRAIRDGDPHAFESPNGSDALEGALKESGYSALIAFPLRHGEAALGALNVYSRETGAFDEKARRIGMMFAEQAAVALHHAGLYGASVTLGEQLQEALKSRAVIDQAKGVLMERLACDADTAFEALREASQRMNRKVRDLAHELVMHAGKGKKAT